MNKIVVYLVLNAVETSPAVRKDPSTGPWMTSFKLIMHNGFNVTSRGVLYHLHLR